MKTLETESNHYQRETQYGSELARYALGLRAAMPEREVFECKECGRQICDGPGETCGSCVAQSRRDAEAEAREAYLGDFSDLDANDGGEDL